MGDGMKILIAYGSTEGHTQKIVETIARQLGEMGCSVGLTNTARLGEGSNPADFDKVIIAGSVHEQAHQELVEAFALSNRAILAGKPSLFISVSLAAAFPDGEAEAQKYVDQFVTTTGWQPGQVLKVAGALRHGEYGFYKEQILSRVVLSGREIDPSQDQEFTDWTALAAVIDGFAAHA